MSTIDLELGAVSIPAGHHVYKCFPGQSYRYYQATVEAKAVFLDIHNLPVLGTDPAGWDSGALQEVIRDAREREDARLNARKPDRKQRTPKANQSLDARNLTLAIGLYRDAKPGDLIVVPAEGYKKDVFIGELQDTAPVEIELRQEEDKLSQLFLARPVRWLAQRAKKDFDLKVIGQLQNPTAFFDIGRKSYEDIYRLAYENYLYGDHTFSTFETRKDKFRNSDNLTVSLWFEYLISAGVAQVTGFEGFQQLSLIDAASTDWDHNLGEEMFININSPGSLAFRAPNQFPIVALSLWALSFLTPAAAYGSEIKVHIHPITSSAPECQIDVEKELKQYLETIGLQRWTDACEVAHRMRNNAAIHAKSRPRR